jgi:hypothetical protein
MSHCVFSKVYRELNIEQYLIKPELTPKDNAFIMLTYYQNSEESNKTGSAKIFVFLLIAFLAVLV